MSRPLISIVIPAYNAEAFLEKTLDSVLAQTYAPLEAVAVDDGSTDGTGVLLDRIAQREARLRVVHQKNAGVTGARLAGIRAGRGAFIGFADADDLFDADMVERLYDNAVRHDAEIAHCGYRMVLPDGATQDFYGSGKVLVRDRETGLADLLEGTLVEPSLCNKLFRRSLFDPLLCGETVMDASLRENEDLLMNYCLFQAAERSVFEDRCLYQYCVRTTSASHGGLKPHILQDPIRIGEILLAETEANAALHLLAARYYVTKLIKAATIPCAPGEDAFRSVRSEARQKLRAFLNAYLSLPETKKRKMLARWAAYSPAVYGVVHRIYQKSR